MKRLKPEGLALIKKKYALKSNTDVAKHIGVNFSTLWRAVNESAGGEFVARTMRTCSGFSFHDLFFDSEIAIAQHNKKAKGA